MPLNLHSIQDSADLLSVLAKVDLSVPGRTDGRTTDHTEVWTICRLLSTLARAGRLTFPLSVVHRDRPDILIQSENINIGIEITEAISQQYAAYCALAEREFPGVFLEPAHFRWGAPTLTVAQMRELLQQTQLTSEGWAGDRPEQEWAEFILGTVDSKLAKLAHPDFAKFEKNWLVVYVNLPLPHIDLSTAIAYLRPMLKDRWLRTPAFDSIFVEHGPVIAQITADGLDNLVLNDLWN